MNIKYFLIILLAIVVSGCAVLLGMSVGVLGAYSHKQERINTCMMQCERTAAEDCKEQCKDK